MNQSELIYNYNNEYRPKFNQDLFKRSDDDIIEELKKIILSCQKNKFFTIRVESFTVVEDYKEIRDILWKYENDLINRNKNSNKKKDNPYDFIDLKDSDIKLLIVKYFISIKNEQEYVDVIIAVPRIVEKFYFRINGNIYSAIYQIVDASTYNNSTSNSKNHSVTLKSMFMPIRMYRYTSTTASQELQTTKKQKLKSLIYTSYIFTKSIPTMKYLLAKFGFYNCLKFLGIGSVIYLTDYDIDDDNYYTFAKNDNVYISAPKYLFDNDNIVQAFVSTFCSKYIPKNIKMEDILSNDFWVSNLGASFNINNSADKGISVLDSLESIYDISTKESIHLPESEKEDIYCILRWMMREFSNLKLKDNLDISTKKIRCAEYIASLYAMRLSSNLYNRISGDGKKAKLSTIKKAIVTKPNALLNAISKCQLVNYRNMINDTDSIINLKFTYKGISGIGEKGSNAVPDIYRLLHESHSGRIDFDSSSSTDPGITGTICPLVKLDNMHFSEFQEPNFWENEFNRLMNNYKALVGLRECISFENSIGIDNGQSIEEVEDDIETVKNLLVPIRKCCDDESFESISNKLFLEAGGVIYYE